jgi:hypothetical protein
MLRYGILYIKDDHNENKISYLNKDECGSCFSCSSIEYGCIEHSYSYKLSNNFYYVNTLISFNRHDFSMIY